MNPYDQTPWEGFPCPASHPDRVGAIARLFGLAPAAVSSCRVLELACAAGANLLPMAAANPNSRFVGVDLSAQQIDDGKREVDALGLANVSLQTGDLARLPANLGTFDFIVAQGVYSWVPPAAQAGLLQAVRDRLAEQGVAYVSFSALPGAYPRLALREMLRWQVRSEASPDARVERARRFAEFVAANAGNRAPHAAALRRLVGEMGGLSDAHVLHDYLADVYAPTTLSTFVGRSGEHGLQYLGDAQLHTMFGEGVDPEVAEGLRADAADQLDFEQTLDFLTHRPFRTALLCRKEHTLDRSLAWQHLDGLYLSTRARSAGQEDGHPSFRTPAGETFGAGSPLVGAALQTLVDAWPRPTEFSSLCDAARTALDGGPARASPQDREDLGRNLVAACASNLIELGTSNRRIAATASPTPIAFSFARQQAARGHSRTTNLWHESVTLEPSQLTLLPLLDGTRTRAQLLDSGADPAALDTGLAGLAASALLVD